MKMLATSGLSLAVMAGSWYIYDFNYPKTLGEFLEWRGGVLSKEDDAFKAVFEENKYFVDKLKMNQLTKDSSPEEAIQKIKLWCETNLVLELNKANDELKEVVSEFCLDSYKTLRGLLIRKKFELISDKDQDYKVIFALYKKNKEFISWLGDEFESKVNGGYSKLKQKCMEDLSKNLNEVSEIQISKVSWWCTTPKEKTVEQLFKKDQINVLSDSEDINLWRDQFNVWKKNSIIMNSIRKWNSDGKDLSFVTDDIEGGKKMKEWCEDSKSKNLGDEGVYPDLYSHVKSVCVKKVGNRG